MMRVLVLHSRYLSGPASGENRVVDDEARLLREAGHEVHVWDPQVEASGPLELAVAAASTVWSRAAARRTRELLRSVDPHVVHVHNVFPALSPSVLRAVSSAGRPLVMTLHNYRLGCLPATFFRDGRICEDCLGRVPWRGVVHACFRSSVGASAALATSIELHKRIGTFEGITLFLAVSRFLREKVIEIGLPAERVVVKSNFTWPAPRREGPGERFVYLGRLAAEKSVETVLRAWADVEAELLVVGDGPEASRLRALAPPSVRFLDTIPGDRVPALLREARALLVPSGWYEGGSPRSILEAYAAGVPVLASRVGALNEVVEDGSSGMLLPVGAPDRWADAARRLLDDAESERLGDRAHEVWRERFSPARALEDLEGTYREAIARSGRSVAG